MGACWFRAMAAKQYPHPACSRWSLALPVFVGSRSGGWRARLNAVAAGGACFRPPRIARECYAAPRQKAKPKA
jgi:hypothetical protein